MDRRSKYINIGAWIMLQLLLYLAIGEQPTCLISWKARHDRKCYFLLGDLCPF